VINFMITAGEGEDGTVTDDAEPPRALPPGQRLADELRTQHYGPVPRFRPERWRFVVNGATADGSERLLELDEIAALPQVTVEADLHCVTKWTVLDNCWGGVAARTILELVPPARGVTHVTAWAEYGYSATLRLEDVAASTTLLALELAGRPLLPERGYPLRLVVPHLYGWKGPKWLRGLEYTREPVRGFWEERGYHLLGDPWREERYSYQE
jgi:DMSO/TMAO reductase YedYZ molybdopterin-dependent catalytic subunit